MTRAEIKRRARGEIRNQADAALETIYGRIREGEIDQEDARLIEEEIGVQLGRLETFFHL